MKAVILAGGFGTRLRPLTANMPKPMVPLAGRPVAEHVVLLLKKHGIKEIIIILHFQSEKVSSYFGDGARWGVNIKYAKIEADYGTAGAIRVIQDELDDTFMVISGDVLTDFDLSAAAEFHRLHKALSTIVLTTVEEPRSYGIVITEKSGKITRFLEKPSWGQVFSDTVNTGIYLLQPQVLQMIPANTEYDFSNDLFPLLLERKMALYGYVASGYWRDIGDVEEYFSAHQDILDGRVEVKLPGRILDYPGARVFVGENVIISPGAEFKGTVLIGDGVRIGPRSRTFHSVIGSGSIVGREAMLSRVVAWDSAFVGPRARVSEAVICGNAYVGEAATVEENCILSENSRVGGGARVKRNVKIWPNKEVESGAVLTSSLVWGEKWRRQLFSEAKVTGICNVEVSPEMAAKLGAAYGAMLGSGQTVAVCRGVSNASRMINRAVICGLLSAGVNVADLRTTPIPVIRQELKTGRNAGAVHTRLNPDGNDEIDIIFLDHDGHDIAGPKTKAIERLFFREDFRRPTVEGVGAIDFPPRVLESYRESFLSSIDASLFSKRNLKVVIDYAFGGAAEILPGILGAIGVNAVSLNSFVDPHQALYFTKKQKEALGQLGSIVKSLAADLGFLLNAGAEKLIAVDERGRVIPPQKMLLKVTQLYCQVMSPKRVAVPVTASAGAAMIAKEAGAEIVWIPSDHEAMMQAMSKGGVDFVAGTKGGFIFPVFQLGVDAMYATVKILELLAATRYRMSQVTGPWDRLVMVEKAVPCTWGKKGTVMRRLIEATESMHRIIVDGVRVQDDGGWVLVRPDRKKALFQIVAESDSKAATSELMKRYAKKIKAWQR